MYEYVIPKEFNQSDRIGNFTMPQALILGAGGVVILFILASSLLLGAILALPILVSTVFLMYKKVNEIPVYEFFLVYLIYRTMPKLLIYKPNNVKDDFWEEEEIEMYTEE